MIATRDPRAYLFDSDLLFVNGEMRQLGTSLAMEIPKIFEDPEIRLGRGLKMPETQAIIEAYAKAVRQYPGHRFSRSGFTEICRSTHDLLFDPELKITVPTPLKVSMHGLGAGAYDQIIKQKRLNKGVNVVLAGLRNLSLDLHLVNRNEDFEAFQYIVCANQMERWLKDNAHASKPGSQRYNHFAEQHGKWRGAYVTQDSSMIRGAEAAKVGVIYVNPDAFQGRRILRPGVIGVNSINDLLRKR